MLFLSLNLSCLLICCCFVRYLEGNPDLTIPEALRHLPALNFRDYQAREPAAARPQPSPQVQSTSPKSSEELMMPKTPKVSEISEGLGGSSISDLGSLRASSESTGVGTHQEFMLDSARFSEQQGM